MNILAQDGGNQLPATYSLTNQQRLVIISDLLNELCPKLPLEVQQAPVPFSQAQISTNQEPPCFYEVLGNSQRRRTQTAYLLTKLKDLQQTHDVEQEPEQTVQDTNRYFNSRIRCFRCKKLGHYNTHCPEQSVFCLFCLSPRHTMDKCPQRVVCFRCYNYGHINAQCCEYEGPYCPHCRRKHKGDCFFLTRGSDHFKEIFDNEYVISDPEIKCIICNQKGHFKCSPTQAKTPVEQTNRKTTANNQDTEQPRKNS